MYHCPLCLSNQAALLGKLGMFTHFRCVDCGGDFCLSDEDLVEDFEPIEEDYQ